MQYEHNELMEVTKEYIKILKESGLGYLRLKNDKFEIELGEKQQPMPNFPPMPPMPPMSGMQPPVQMPGQPAGAPPKAEVKSGNVVTSPIVGTFYASPSPEKPPFVTVGKQVHKGDVLFIIESMKLMNEVTSEFDGTVAEIMAENADTVEFGQPIMRIE